MLEEKVIGFIGAGMMGEAVARGLLKAGVPKARIHASDPEPARRELFRKQLGIAITADNRAVAEGADIIILAVKPFVVPDVLGEIAHGVNLDKLLISIAAGVTTDSIERKLGAKVPVVRAMPNTPCLLGEGATGITAGQYADFSHLELASQIFKAVGLVAVLPEDKIDAVTGLSGSGPAFVYMFIEALADGGVRMGLPRAIAIQFAAQTVAGAARMVLDSGAHPGELRDRVTTPGGTTIAGIASLERSGFRAAAIEAVTAATERSIELGKLKG
jgi:pyrroline-5-carboxylate reductase